jgi:outer membrane protein OmpA-like peptidoglycan-associated protein
LNSLLHKNNIASKSVMLYGKANHVVQPKLTINTPGDIYEQEADAMADRVMRMSSNETAKPVTGLIGKSLQRKCAHCEEEEKKKPIMRKTEAGSNAGMSVSSSFASSLNASKGSGLPLPQGTRSFMENALKADFSNVRIHSDTRANEMSCDIHAKAFTYGKDVYFNNGQFAPESNVGKKLIAHELIHVLQQTGCGISGTINKVGSHTLSRQPLSGFRPKHYPQISRLLGSELLDNFTLESYTLTEEHKRQLTFHALILMDLLQRYPGSAVSITGHTDATGTDAFNDKLGQQRADAVMNFLIELGVFGNVFISSSKGESELLNKMSGTEGSNRRVEVRFILSSRGESSGIPELNPPQEPSKVERPDLTYKPHDETQSIFGGVAKPVNCGSVTECFASSSSDFDEQPDTLRSLIKKSRPDISESQWFSTLDSELCGALTSIFNRLCNFRLLCYLRSIVKIEAGEAHVSKIPVLHGLGIGFTVPGKTASVYFTVSSGPAMLQALIGTGNFCVDGKVSGLLHAGKTSLREISTSDSLHVSIDGNNVDAHMDKYAPIQGQPEGIFCPDAPTPEAIKHIGNEVIPEYFRKVTDFLTFGIIPIPGITVFPDPIGKSPVPEPHGTVGNDLPPSLVGLTLRGPFKLPPKRKTPAVIMLPDDLEAELLTVIPKLIDNDSLTPLSAKRNLVLATKAATEAGPDEEAALTKAKFAAQSNLDSFATEAHYFAEDMARRMGEAKRKGSSHFIVELGTEYKELAEAEKQYIREHIRQIAVIVRGLLQDRAAGVSHISVKFGDVTSDVDF